LTNDFTRRASLARFIIIIKKYIFKILCFEKNQQNNLKQPTPPYYYLFIKKNYYYTIII